MSLFGVLPTTVEARKDSRNGALLQLLSSQDLVQLIHSRELAPLMQGQERSTRIDSEFSLSYTLKFTKL